MVYKEIIVRSLSIVYLYEIVDTNKRLLNLYVSHLKKRHKNKNKTDMDDIKKLLEYKKKLISLISYFFIDLVNI